MPHGQGLMNFPNDMGYLEGTWEFGKLVEGQFIYPNGNVYMGAFSDASDVKDDNDVVDINGGGGPGELKLPLPSGRGRMMYSSGSVENYEGDFLRGLPEGEGVAIFRNGDKYEGEWMKGKQHGRGVQTHKVDGSVYEGAFENGKKHGAGRMKYVGDDEVYEHVWENGEAKNKDNLRLAMLKMKAKDVLKMEELAKQELEEKNVKNPCAICGEKTINSIFLECRHAIACLDCTIGLKECPKCNEPIVRVVQTFRS